MADPEGPVTSEEEATDIPHTNVQSTDLLYENKKAKAIEFVNDPDKITALTSADLYPVIAFLRHGNFTVKEITDAYPGFSLNISDPKNKKSDKTIYRYLSKLKSLGLIDEVGQRVTSGQIVNEKLWGRTAKIFYVEDSDGKIINTDYIEGDYPGHAADGLHLSALKGVAITCLLKLKFGKVNEDFDYSKWYHKLENGIKDEFKKLVTQLDEEDLNIIASLPYSSIDWVLNFSAILSLTAQNATIIDKFKAQFHKDESE